MSSSRPCIGAIQKQLEFYFSDANLSQDGFFKWEILKSPDFSLSTDLLLKCNRIRLLGATQEDIVQAASFSELLEVVDGNAAIRRKSAVSFSHPENDCIVLATGIPSLSSCSCESQPTVSNTKTRKRSDSVECSTPDGLTISSGNESQNTSLLIDRISSKLSKYGEVDYVKIPRFKTSSDVRGFAFVQFANSESAKRAIAELRPTIEDLSIPTSDVTTHVTIDSDVTVDSAAWTPKMLASAHLPLNERLARQFVWRCCSRRSKQVVSAFRRLRASGYHLPNPLESEYRSLIGSKLALAECVTDKIESLELKGLRLLSYDDYLRWRPRFYTWLKAWTIRMNRKAEILQAMTDRKRALMTSIESPVAATSASFGSIDGKVAKLDSTGSLATDSDTDLLPNDYCSGTVVEVCWPFNLVVATCPPIAHFGKTPLETDNRYKIRLIRGFIERNFLQPNNLLKNVVHFDGNPSEEVLKKIPNRLKEIPLFMGESDFLRCFIRFCDHISAEQFANLTQSVTCSLPSEASTSLSQADASSFRDYFTQFQMGFLLNRNEESIYCEAIIASKIGVRERRRKIQSKRRQRLKKSLGVNDHPPNNKESSLSKTSHVISKSTRIVFDD